MKSFDRLIAGTAAFIILAFFIINILPVQETNTERLHNVEINRIVRVITDTGDIPDIGAYKTIVGIYLQTDAESSEATSSGSFFFSSNDYVIREINGRLYRIEYSEMPENHGCLRQPA